MTAKVHPDDRERLTAAVAALSPEKPYLQISYRVARPNGTVIWVERNSRAHFDEQGRMLRVVGMVSDIGSLLTSKWRPSGPYPRVTHWGVRDRRIK